MEKHDPVGNAGQRLYDVARVARILRVSRSTIYRQIQDGVLPVVQVRSRKLIPADTIDGLIAAALTSTAQREQT
jgi:excisionase family DNA binding protein